MIGLLARLIPRKAKRPSLRNIFVPVIFANGHDDDLPGFTAACENRAFQFDDRIYQPDDELVVEKRVLAFSCPGIFISDPDGPKSHVPEGWVLIREGDPSRKIIIDNCDLIFNLRVCP